MSEVEFTGIMVEDSWGKVHELKVRRSPDRATIKIAGYWEYDVTYRLSNDGDGEYLFLFHYKDGDELCVDMGRDIRITADGTRKIWKLTQELREEYRSALEAVITADSGSGGGHV